jgi:hypothetical protein
MLLKISMSIGGFLPSNFIVIAAKCQFKILRCNRACPRGPVSSLSVADIVRHSPFYICHCMLAYVSVCVGLYMCRCPLFWVLRDLSRKQVLHVVSLLEGDQGASQWNLGYAAYKKSPKNGGGQCIIGHWSRIGWPKNSKKSPNNSALALSETLKGLMAEKQDANAKRDAKWRREKEATCASFIDLIKGVLEIQTIEAEAKNYSCSTTWALWTW